MLTIQLEMDKLHYCVFVDYCMFSVNLLEHHAELTQSLLADTTLVAATQINSHLARWR